MNKRKVHYDCWSPYERKVQYALENVKKFAFYPVLRVLIKAGISADILSYSFAILGAIAAFYMFIDLRIAAVVLIISVLGDGIDGSVARMTKKDGAKGAFTDEFCDQIVIIATTIAFARLGLLDSGLAIYYAATYPLVIVFSVLRNRLGIPNSYVFRPRLLMYSLFILGVFTNINLLNEAALIFSIIATIYIVHDFIKLKEYA